MNGANSFAFTHVAGHVIGGGRYSLHVPLGESELVWLAQDEVDQRLAVIRFLPHELREDARAMDGLRSRIQSLAGFSHPGVARLMEWYEAEGVEPFIAAEYVEGTPVSDLQVNGRVPWEKLRPIAAQAAAALAALHGANVVHHGIEPANIVVTPDGVKLLNAVVTGVLRNPLFVPAALTDPRALRFFSSGQLQGSAPVPADDVFSLGATLFELAAGRPVFPDAKHTAAARTLSGENVADALREAGDIPAAIIDFIAGALVLDPGQRPTLDALLALKADAAFASVSGAGKGKPAVVPLVVEPVREAVLVKQVREPLKARSRMPWLAAACLMICAVAASGAWYVQRAKAEKERAAAQAAADREAELRAEAQRAEAEQRAATARVEKERKEQERQAQAAAAAKAAEQARLAAQAELERQQIHAQFAARPASASAAQEAQPLPASSSDEGFVTLFNGRDLSEWTSNSKYWSVVEGAITAQCDQNAPKKKRFYLVSKQEAVQDFELRFEYRMRLLRGNKQPNGGVVYRATTNNTPELSAYQFDVVPDAKNAGAVNDDKKRYRLAGHGENAVALANDKNSVVGQITKTNVMNSVQPEDWNRCVIVARGSQLTHYINGHVAANLVDENVRKLHKKGLIALEMHTRNTNNAATFIQFKEIKLKRLSPSTLALKQ